MIGLIYALCAITGLAGFSYVMLVNRGRWTGGRAATASAFAFVAVGMTFSVPAVGSALDRATGLNELWRVLAHLCVMGLVAAAEAQIVILAFPPEEVRRPIIVRIWVSVAAATVLVALFIVASARPEPVLLNVDDARVPVVSAYLLVYVGAFVWYNVDFFRLAWRFSRVTPRPWSRRGLRIAAYGAGFGFAYCISKAAFVVGYWTGLRPSGERTVSAILIMMACILGVVGSTMPAWGPAIDVLRRSTAHRRCYRRLYPLWRDLIHASPDLVLDSKLDHSRAPMRGVDFALARRVVEICDARLALRPWIKSDAVASTDREAVDEAARIASGIDAQRLGHMPEYPDSTPIFDPEGGFEGQVEWLVKVASEYRRLRSDSAANGKLTEAVATSRKT